MRTANHPKEDMVIHSLMPKGVEHHFKAYYALMPKGVEHIILNGLTLAASLVIHSLMPKGVEHRDTTARAGAGRRL